MLESGRVVSVSPALLTVKGAATYCACSPSLLDHLRAADAQRRRLGEPMIGPAWVRVVHGIRYKIADLDAWLERTAEPFGVMESRRREKPGAGPEHVP